MILLLTLAGKHGADGRADSHLTGDRIVSVDMDDEKEMKDVQRFFNPDDGVYYWGLKADKAGWWKIVDAYEAVDVTEELHEGRYPMFFNISADQFFEIVKSKDVGLLYLKDKLVELYDALNELVSALASKSEEAAASGNVDLADTLYGDSEDASGYVGEIGALIDKDAADGEPFTDEQRETVAAAQVFLDSRHKEA